MNREFDAGKMYMIEKKNRCAGQNDNDNDATTTTITTTTISICN